MWRVNRSKQRTPQKSSTDKAAVMDPQRFLRWFGVMAKSNHRDCLRCEGTLVNGDANGASRWDHLVHLLISMVSAACHRGLALNPYGCRSQIGVANTRSVGENAIGSADVVCRVRIFNVQSDDD